MRRYFVPTSTQLPWLIALGFASVGYAMYLRYLGIENTLVGLSCDAGMNTWMCLSRKVSLALYEHFVFGAVALGAAILNLIRPSVPLFAIGLAATGLGLVLYNAGLAALAAGLLIMSFARPVVDTE